MADFAHARQDWLKTILDLPHGVPSHDTFSRVFRLLEPAPFEAAFIRFAAGFTGKLKGVVAIDGKALRGAYKRGAKASPLHMVNIWASETRMAIASKLAPNRNEIAGALEALALISLEGCILTADALYCRPDIASAIIVTARLIRPSAVCAACVLWLLACELARKILRPELLGIERRRRWTQDQKLAVLNEIGVDGASVSDVARRHDVPRQNLYQWRRDVQRKALSESLGVTFIPVASPAEPLRTTPAGSMSAVEILLRNGRGLRGIAGMAENELTHLIRVIERA